MSDNEALDLLKQHRAAYDKYTYLLLAIGASAVAFVVQKSEGVPLTWSTLPLGLSVLSFGLSFWFGIKTLNRVIATLGATYNLILLQEGVHPDQPSDGDPLTGAEQGVRHAIVSDTDRADNFARWQYRLLIAGGLLFLVWHILTMYQATNAIK